MIKNLIILLALIVSAKSCAMGARQKRLITPIDQSKSVWEFCTPKMIKEYKGKLCLVVCEIELKTDGSCKKDQFKYIIKDLKEDHDFFMNKHVVVPERMVY